jgi:pimeloyl-ACP methyl ester carboxylesterase
VAASVLAPSYRVLAIDLRGRGLSEKPPPGYLVEHHCKDILALMENLGLDRTVLMGHSLGDLISLVFTAKNADRIERLILVDGAGKLDEKQMGRVLAGIKPSLDRLGQIFPSYEAYIETMKLAPFLKPWSSALETYFRYEAEDLDGSVRSRVHLEHIQEEIENLGRIDMSYFYPRVNCPVLILRATEEMLTRDDLVLPEEVASRMIQEIPQVRRVDVEGVNHYSIIFQPSEIRDNAIKEFLFSEVA